MASNMENFNEYAVARNDDTAGYENDMTETVNNMTGAEETVDGTECTMPGAGDNIDGTEFTMLGAEDNIDGTEYTMPAAEENIDGTEYTMPAAEENINGTENTIDGIENVTDEGNENMTGANKNTENQEQAHSEDPRVKSSEKRWPGWPGESVFRILVPYQKVGGIIGRKGELIKKICEESKARIKVLDTPPSAPERAVIISAKEEPDASISPAMDGLLRIHKRIIDGLDGEPRAPQKAGHKEATRLLAGATQTGTLIGKHGSTIKSIQEASNCVIRVIDDIPPFALPDDKVIEIQGEPTGMHKALELIASHLRKFLVDRSVVPLFEINMSRPMSQMQHSMPTPQPWGHPQGPPPNVGGSGFAGNSQFMLPRPHGNFYPPPDLPPFEKPPHHGISTFGRDVPPMGVNPSNNQHGQGNQVTQHIQVPISFADAVIGAGGANISYIRRASGATITIQETRGVPGEMTVEINGSATQVQTAQQLIQNFMAEAGAPSQAPAPPADQHGYNSYPQQSYGSTYNAAGPPANAAAAAPPTGAYPASSYAAHYGY